MESSFGKVASEEEINKTAEALKANGFDVIIVDSKEAAKDTAIKLVPKGSETFTGASVTLDESGISEVVNGPDYDSARAKMMALYNEPEKAQEMKRVTAAPDYMLSSAHALTQDGKIMVASASGSQIPSEAYGAAHVIFVVGAQKIVKDLNDGLARIQEYVVPLEDKRAQKAYGTGTNFSRLFVLNNDKPERTTVVIIKEKIGY